MGKWCNYQAEPETVRKWLDLSIKQTGAARIYTVLNHVSSSGMTRVISAFVPVIIYEEYYDDKNKVCEMPVRADMVCIARERKVSGCGMDMGFHLAYSLYMSAYPDYEKYPYQEYLSHSWL
jgi:hypothetical protein